MPVWSIMVGPPSGCDGFGLVEPGDGDDVVADAVDVAEDVVVPETGDGPAVLFEVAGSLSVLQCGLSLAVLRAVDLHDELFIVTGEVDDVARDRNLATEAEAHQSMSAQLVPQLQLRVGHHAAHLLGIAAETWRDDGVW